MIRKRRKPWKKREKRFVDLGLWNAHFQARLLLMDGVESDFANVPWRSWRFGTTAGLWRQVDDAIELLAIENHCPGNGDFLLAIGALETKARAAKLAIRVRQFENDRLKNWFLKRGYSAGMSQLDGTDFCERKW